MQLCSLVGVMWQKELDRIRLDTKVFHIFFVPDEISEMASDKIGQHWYRSDRVGMDLTGLGWIGLDRTGGRLSSCIRLVDWEPWTGIGAGRPDRGAV